MTNPTSGVGHGGGTGSIWMIGQAGFAPIRIAEWRLATESLGLFGRTARSRLRLNLRDGEPDLMRTTGRFRMPTTGPGYGGRVDPRSEEILVS